MQIKELIIKAIEEDCFYKILLGQDEYKCEISQFIAAEVPTDWPNIIRALYMLYKDMPDLRIRDRFEEAIIYIYNQDFFGVYCAVMVIFFQIMSEERHIAAFTVNREEILRSLRGKQYFFEKELKGCKEWTGKKYQNGLWGDIQRVNNILNEDYEITII